MLTKIPVDDNLVNKNNGVVVALLPQDDAWCKVQPCHMTLVYVGTTENLKPTIFNSLAKDVASIAMLSSTIMAKVIGVSTMGDDEPVDVLRISPTPEILALRNMLESWDDSEFPNFNPHATIGPAGSWNPESAWDSQSTPMPMYLIFDRISILWGSDTLTFWLRKY